MAEHARTTTALPPREARIDGRLGDLLVDTGAATRNDVERAASAGRESHRRLGESLIELGLAEERDVYQQLARLHHLRFADVADLLAIVDPELVARISRQFQEYHLLVPLAVQGQRLLVATSDPDAFHPELASAAGARDLELVLITPTDYRRLRLALDLSQASHGPAGANGKAIAPNLMASEHNLSAPIVELFQAIMLDAIAERASDIHLEVYGERVRVRIRVDGDLRDVPHFRLTPAQMLAVVSIAKVRAKMDLAEHRAPQGGRFTVRLGDHQYDVRAQTQPTLHGEHLVLRLLPQDARLLTIADLGFPDDLAHVYRRLLDSPGGFVLVVGPTGSGKSTTLYAGLQVLAAETTRKVITIEDPIEYAIEGVQQSQVLPEVGFTFANAMRAFVREDPDVILIGEIRDGETALEALRASQTGHLVLSTLHCNDTVDAVQRLLDLGMHPNSIASELAAVFAQRLAKRICEGCRESHTPPAELLAEIFPGGPPAEFAAFQGAGCSRCGGTGSHGRIALVEHLGANSNVRRAISKRVTVEELRDAAIAAGLIPMRTHALDLVQHGVIALEELPEVLTPERLAPQPTADRARPVGRSS
jgi:type IV pilus assembly protein PilB